MTTRNQRFYTQQDKRGAWCVYDSMFESITPALDPHNLLVSYSEYDKQEQSPADNAALMVDVLNAVDQVNPHTFSPKAWACLYGMVNGIADQTGAPSAYKDCVYPHPTLVTT